MKLPTEFSCEMEIKKVIDLMKNYKMWFRFFLHFYNSIKTKICSGKEDAKAIM